MVTPRMTMGHGVAEAVAMQVRELTERGMPTLVGCLESDGHYADVPTRRVAPDAAAVADAASLFGAAVIVAHGSPYFEILPPLTGPYRTIVYEYGDPTPELFGPEAGARRAVARYKHDQVYPAVDHVACISEFIRRDIDWPAAVVITLGIEHVADLGPKPATDPEGPLRVGALMRLGPGEARYKGHAELMELTRLVRGVSWELAGRGTDSDAAALRDAGIRTHLNPSTAQRSAFLRDIDVFVTTSLWEGTNLPLVEAQALGTPGLAFTTAAHPEFTPFTFDSVTAMAHQLELFRDQRDTVAGAGQESYAFVHRRMSWSNTVSGLLELTQGAPDEPPPARSRLRREWARAGRFGSAIRDAGIRQTLHDQIRRRRGKQVR